MRRFLVVTSAWARVLACIVVLFTTLALADVKFTEPQAGASLTAGQIDIRWEDSGISPPISELTQYTLSLMVGGNDLNAMQPVATFESEGAYSAGSSAHGTIPAGIAANVPNGFFFRMTSTKEAGGVLINYSDRFSISGLTGDTALRIRQAAQALNGNTKGPSAEGNDASSAISSALTTSTGVVSTTASSTLASPTTTYPSATTHLTTTESSDTATKKSTSSSATSSNPSSASSLSKGAIAGIAVTATIAIIGLSAALAFFFYTRQRKKQTEVQEIAPGTDFRHNAMSELSAEQLVSPKTFWSHTTELSSESMVHEAGSGERPPELDHMAFRAELEGSQPGTAK